MSACMHVCVRVCVCACVYNAYMYVSDHFKISIQVRFALGRGNSVMDNESCHSKIKLFFANTTIYIVDLK